LPVLWRTRDIEEAKKLYILSFPFFLDFEEGKRVVRSETLLIGMGKILTPPSLISELQCLSRRICCTRSLLRRRGNTRLDFRHFVPISAWAVFRIRDILIRIRIPALSNMDPAPDPALYVSDLQDAKKKITFIMFAFYFLKVH
jgi:hypothetical protein